MKSTMQHVPLAVSRLLAQGSSSHATSTVATWTGEGARTSGRSAER